MSLDIRQATMNDHEVIYGFICELEQETLNHSGFKSKFEKIVSSPDWSYYVIENNQETIGLVSLQLLHLLHHDGVIAEIQEFYIIESFRNQGIGKRTIEFLKNRAKELNCSQIELSTNKKRTGAFHFYKRCGFEDTHHKLMFKL